MDNIRILLDYIQTANLLPSSELHHLNNIVNNNNFALPIILQEHVIFIYDDNKNHQIIKICSLVDMTINSPLSIFHPIAIGSQLIKCSTNTSFSEPETCS